MKSNAVVKIFATALVACGAFAANSAGFDGMTLVTNDWFDANFTTSLVVDTPIATNTTTGITRGAGTWTEAPTNGTAKIVTDEDAVSEATCLSLNAPGELLKFTPAYLPAPSGMETVTAHVKIMSVDSELPAVSVGAQGAFALKVGGEDTLAVHGLTATGWTNLVYASAQDLTNDWVTVAMDFATVSNVRYVRYSVTPAGGSRTVLEDSTGAAWFPAGGSATTVTAVGFSGVGIIRTFSGDSLAEPVATCNGENYATVADAIAAAEEGDTVTLVKTAYNELISITKNVAIDLNSNPLNCDSFNIAEGTTLTVVNTGNKQIKAPAFTGGGSIVATKGLRLCPNSSSGVSSLESITVTGDLSFDSGSAGTFNVTGVDGLSATGTVTVRDMKLNVTGMLSASVLNLAATDVIGRSWAGGSATNRDQTLVTAGELNATVGGGVGKLVVNGDVVMGGNEAITFSGNMVVENLTIQNSAATTLYGTNAITGALTIDNGGTVKLGNPYELGAIGYDIDASRSEVERDENDYITVLKDSNGGSVTLITNSANATVSLTVQDAEPTVFGGKPVYNVGSALFRETATAGRTNNDRASTTFIAWKCGSKGSSDSTPAIYSVLFSGGTQQGDQRRGIQTHGNNSFYFRDNNNYGGTEYIYANGAANATWSTDEQLLTVCGCPLYTYYHYARYGNGKSGTYIAEILYFRSDFALDERAAIEAYLMDKWGIGDVKYTPINPAASLVFKNDSTLDLNGIAQVVKSVSGQGTVSNGVLKVTDAISVPVGNTLVIPYGSTYTLANDGSYAVTNVEAGTITITHCAADIGGVPYETVEEAIAAYESGILTVHESAVIDFGTTEVNVTNAVLDTGVVLTFTQNAPWMTEYDRDAGTIVNTRVASTYVWTPGESSTDWATLSNWRISSATPVALPGANDTVSFASSGTVTLSANVDVGTLSIADAIRVQFTAESLKNLVVGDYICGSGTTNALSNIKLVPQEKDVAYTLDIGGIVEIVDGTDNQIRATSHRVDGSNKPAMTLTISGNLIGGGNVEFGSNSGQSRAYVNLAGDNSGFTGVATINGNNTGSFRWMSADSGSASARWVTDNAPTMNFGFTDGTLKLGSFETSTGVSLASNSTPSLEIGGYGTDSELGSNFARGSGSKSLNLVKTGSGKLVFSGRIANGNGQGNITIENGTLDIAAQQSLPNAGSALTMTGGILAVSGTTTDAEENTVFVDPSAYIKNCTTYPITFSNAVGEVHAWATALAASNTGGLVKKGEGTLVLANAPLYTGATVLRGGTLKIPANAGVKVTTDVKGKVVLKSKSDDGIYTVYALGNKRGTIAIIY